MHSSDLFERYLQAVRKFLPWERQADIVAELRANLEAQREEREAELGRPLSEGEMIDWLKELGPPHQMAARYQPPRHLIGPAVFPMYWNILRLVLIWASVAYGVSIVVRLVAESHSPQWVAGQVGGLWGVLIMAAAWVTGIFAVFEFVSERYPEKCPDFLAPASHWSPTTLPPLEKTRETGTKPPSLMGLAAELVVQFAFIIWLLLIPHHPYLLFGPGTEFVRTGPVVLLPIAAWFYWSVLAVAAVQFAWKLYIVLSDTWWEKNTLGHLAMKTVGILPTIVMIAAPGHAYVAANPFALHSLPPQFSIAMLNHTIFMGFTVVALITIFQLVWDAWKAMAGTNHPLGAVL